MKLNDFHKRSNPNSTSDLQKRLGRSSKISFVNETQVNSYEKKLQKLTKENSRLTSVLSELETAKLQRQEAVAAKQKAEQAFDDLAPKYKLLQTSFKEFEDREPRIKEIINQHRELNGQVAELQSKLQLVIEQHDQKVDLVNDKIDIIAELKNSLHRAETSDTKAQQDSLEANMKQHALQAKLDQEIKKSDALSIIYQEEKDKVFSNQKERNEFEVNFIKAETERNKSNKAAQSFKSLSENQAEALKDLASQYYYISELNKGMLAELKKPRFASVASISKKEGFKFPTSYEPRSNTLGTGKPTLLRKKE